jgi:hypothetical protein
LLNQSFAWWMLRWVTPLDHQLLMGIFKHSWALRRAVCTTSPVYCPYWLRQDTNPHSIPPFPVTFQNNAMHEQLTNLHALTLYSSELLQNPAFGRCLETVRPFFLQFWFTARLTLKWASCCTDGQGSDHWKVLMKTLIHNSSTCDWKLWNSSHYTTENRSSYAPSAVLGRC